MLVERLFDTVLALLNELMAKTPVERLSELALLIRGRGTTLRATLPVSGSHRVLTSSGVTKADQLRCVNCTLGWPRVLVREAAIAFCAVSWQELTAKCGQEERQFVTPRRARTLPCHGRCLDWQANWSSAAFPSVAS
jgi:hypothetical protein